MAKYRINRRLALAALPCFAVGCLDGGSRAEDLGRPDASSSRKALAAALDSWKAGRRDTGALVGSNPAVGIVDSTRLDRPLVDYKIEGPLMAVGKTLPFAVRLVLGEPSEIVQARYVIVGRDPLWVFRQEDFDRMLHWEHKMDEGTSTTPPATNHDE